MNGTSVNTLTDNSGDAKSIRQSFLKYRSTLSIVSIDFKTKRPRLDLLPKGDGGKPTWKPFQSAIADEPTCRRWMEGKPPLQALAEADQQPDASVPDLRSAKVNAGRREQQVAAAERRVQARGV